MEYLRGLAAFRERIAGSPARRASYYALSQAAYNCLAGSFEMPMALRLAGRIDLVAFVYFFFYCSLLAGFALGLVLVREGRASFVFRLELGLLAALGLCSAALFPLIAGLPALIAYFLVRGLAEGLYWAARHRAMLWSVRDAGRDRFVLKLQSLVVSVSVVLPLVGGFVITGLDLPGIAAASGAASGAAASVLPAGYAAVFLLTGSVLLIALVLSPDFRIGRSPVSFRRTFALGRLAEAASWRAYLGMLALAGVCVSVGSGVLNFGVLKTEFRIGAFNASVAFLSGLSFTVLGRTVAGRARARTRGVLVGAMAEFLSRASYALFPRAGVLAVKGVLDSAAVPLKSLFGENINFALIERISERSGASIAEIYLYREIRIWMFRVLGCAVAGIAVALALASAPGAAAGAPGGAAAGASRSAARVLLALAAPVPLVEALFVRSFARANAAARKPGGPSIG